MSPRPLSLAAVLLTLTLVAALLGCHKQPVSNASSEPSANRDPESSSPLYSRAATLERIRSLITIGDVIEAQQLVRSHLLRFPDDADAMVLAAQLAAARGQVDEAVNLLDSAANLSVEQERFLKAQSGLLLSQAGRWQEAIERLEALVDEHPDFDAARHQLAGLLNSRGFRFDANEHIRELCCRSGASIDELKGLMVPSRSHAHFSEKPNIENSEDLDRLGRISVARALRSAGDVRDASEVMAQSQEIQENHPAAIAFYGQVLFESQQFEAFAAWLRNADPECRRYPAYWMALGDWAMRHQKHDSAVRMFAEAILREPGDIASNDRMAQALAAAGQLDASERFRQRGVEIDMLIQETKAVLEGHAAGPDSINEISQLLNRIGRPLESLAWYRVALLGMGSPSDAMRKLEEAIGHAQDSDFQASTRQRLLCGIDLEQFPLDLASVHGDSTPTRSIARPKDQARPKPLPPSFVNVARNVKLDFQYFNAPIPRDRGFRIFQQVGSGVACFDFDLDGQVDFYVGQASAEPPGGRGTRPNLLARNVGDRFVDTTMFAGCDDRGYTCGVTSGDWNQDGFPDLIVGNMFLNTLFLNQGDGTFLSQRGDSVWNTPKYTASLAVGDIDGDQLPDIVEVNYLDDQRIFDPIVYNPDGTPVALPGPLMFKPCVDRVFLSRGDGSLSGQVLDDPTRTAAATGLGVLLTDIDGNPGNEIFIANDHLANHLWERTSEVDPRGNFWKNTAVVRGIAYGPGGTPLGCMGVAAADFDENGRLDLHVTNFENQWSNHYMQNSSGFFEDLVVAIGLDRPTYKMLGFGVQAIDYDNNTMADLVVGNGHVDDYVTQGRAFEMPTQVFALDRSQFMQMPVVGDSDYWGSGHLSRGLATCDWNNDGRLDFVVTDLKQPLALLENRTETSFHWLQLRLVGTRSERDAVGATVKAVFGNRTITKVVQSGDGYMSKNESLVCFGLGESNSAERLEIRWPDGHQQTLTEIAADRRWLIIQNEDEPFAIDLKLSRRR